MGKIKRLVVYTALFGDYDYLRDPPTKYENCDFICFTDRKDLKTDIWKTVIIDELDLPPNLMNRKFKILPHLFLNNYQWSLYIDSNVIIRKNPYDLAIKYLTKYKMVVPKHPKRNCLYEEAIEVMKLKLADKKIIEKQIQKLKKEGFPKNFGLSENKVLFRQHNDEKIKKIMTDWWKEVLYLPRDQLSLAYVLWKNKENFYFMEESVRGGKYFKVDLHKKEYKDGFLGQIVNMKKLYGKNYPNSFIIKLGKKLKELLIKE